MIIILKLNYNNKMLFKNYNKIILIIFYYLMNFLNIMQLKLIKILKLNHKKIYMMINYKI